MVQRFIVINPETGALYAELLVRTPNEVDRAIEIFRGIREEIDPRVILRTGD